MVAAHGSSCFFFYGMMMGRWGEDFKKIRRSCVCRKITSILEDVYGISYGKDDDQWDFGIASWWLKLGTKNCWSHFCWRFASHLRSSQFIHTYHLSQFSASMNSFMPREYHSNLHVLSFRSPYIFQSCQYVSFNVPISILYVLYTHPSFILQEKIEERNEELHKLWPQTSGYGHPAIPSWEPRITDRASYSHRFCGERPWWSWVPDGLSHLVMGQL